MDEVWSSSGDGSEGRSYCQSVLKFTPMTRSSDEEVVHVGPTRDPFCGRCTESPLQLEWKCFATFEMNPSFRGYLPTYPSEGDPNRPRKRMHVKKRIDWHPEMDLFRSSVLRNSDTSKKQFLELIGCFERTVSRRGSLSVSCPSSSPIAPDLPGRIPLHLPSFQPLFYRIVFPAIRSASCLPHRGRRCRFVGRRVCFFVISVQCITVRHTQDTNTPEAHRSKANEGAWHEPKVLLRPSRPQHASSSTCQVRRNGSEWARKPTAPSWREEGQRNNWIRHQEFRTPIVFRSRSRRDKGWLAVFNGPA